MEAYMTSPMTKDCLEELERLDNETLDKLAMELNMKGVLDQNKGEAYYLLANILIGMMEKN